MHSNRFDHNPDLPCPSYEEATGANSKFSSNSTIFKSHSLENLFTTKQPQNNSFNINTFMNRSGSESILDKMNLESYLNHKSIPRLEPTSFSTSNFMATSFSIPPKIDFSHGNVFANPAIFSSAPTRLAPPIMQMNDSSNCNCSGGCSECCKSSCTAILTCASGSFMLGALLGAVASCCPPCCVCIGAGFSQWEAPGCARACYCAACVTGTPLGAACGITCCTLSFFTAPCVAACGPFIPCHEVAKEALDEIKKNIR